MNVSAGSEALATIAELGRKRGLSIQNNPKRPSRPSRRRSRFPGSGPQETFDFCGKHGIAAEIATIPINQVKEAFERVICSDVRFRFVIDMGRSSGGERHSVGHRQSAAVLNCTPCR